VKIYSGVSDGILAYVYLDLYEGPIGDLLSWRLAAVLEGAVSQEAKVNMGPPSPPPPSPAVTSGR